MPAFSKHDLKAVTLEQLKRAATTLQMPTYGNKRDIAGRIATCPKGDVILRKLIETSAKKTKEKTNAHSGFVNATKKLSDAVCKLRNLTLVKEDYSKPTPVFQYKINLQPQKKGTSSKPLRVTTPAKRVADAADDEVDEELVLARLNSKKIKREHINGMLEGFGVDASSWSLAHAKEELVMQMLYESDDEDN